MRIFIAGGTGFVGEHVTGMLLGRGHGLRMLVHSRNSAPVAGVEHIAGDVTKLESFEKAVEGCDVVINLVGIIREFPARGVTFERMHIHATANMLEAAGSAGVRRFLQMSALGTRPNSISLYHQSKYRAEELVRSSGLDYTILRPSLVFGPKDTFINMLAGQLRLTPVMPVIGSGTYRLQPIHADDVARCFALALDLSETIGQTYELCGSTRLSYVELLDAVAFAMGRHAPFKPRIPLGLMKSIIPALQQIPLFPITMDQLQMLLEESICEGCWQKVFRFEPLEFRSSIQEYLHR